LWRYAPFIVLAAAMALVWAMDWHKQLTLENIANHRDALQQAVTEHHTLALIVYIGVYMAVAGLSLPGGTVITLAGGMLFGCVVGVVAAVIGATAGATIVFLIARTALGDTLARKAGPLLAKVRGGFQRNALSYLLFLRLVPAFPFWVVNLAPALLGVPLRTYIFGTFLGIIPGTLAIASMGAGLDAVIVSAKAEYAACLMDKGATACTFAIHAGTLINEQIVGGLVLLGVVALLPVLWRKRT